MKKSTLWLAGVFAIVCALLLWQSSVKADADYADWVTDLPKALVKAKAEHKYVFLDFTGSDWCPNCKEVHKRIFTTPEFQSFAQTNLVLVLVDFPERKKQSDELKKANEALREKYAIQGYPTLILLDGEGKVLDTLLGYGGEPPKEFIDRLKSKMAKS